MTSSQQLQRLLDAAQSDFGAEETLLAELLTATVYAHVPGTLPPGGRAQFMRFVHPNNGQTVLPIFSDQAKAEAASGGRTGIVAMSGRQLLELTRGATLMLNPIDHGYLLYPEEVAALLSGRSIGTFSTEKTIKNETVGTAAPSIPVDVLVTALVDYFSKEPVVQAGYLMELHRGKDLADVSLLVTIVVPSREAERITRASMVAAQPALPSLALPLLVTPHQPEDTLPSAYEQAVCFYRCRGGAD